MAKPSQTALFLKDVVEIHQQNNHHHQERNKCKDISKSPVGVYASHSRRIHLLGVVHARRGGGGVRRGVGGTGIYTQWQGESGGPWDA